MHGQDVVQRGLEPFFHFSITLRQPLECILQDFFWGGGYNKQSVKDRKCNKPALLTPTSTINKPSAPLRLLNTNGYVLAYPSLGVQCSDKQALALIFYKEVCFLSPLLSADFLA